CHDLADDCFHAHFGDALCRSLGRCPCGSIVLRLNDRSALRPAAFVYGCSASNQIQHLAFDLSGENWFQFVGMRKAIVHLLRFSNQNEILPLKSSWRINLHCDGTNPVSAMNATRRLLSILSSLATSSLIISSIFEANTRSA